MVVNPGHLEEKYYNILLKWEIKIPRKIFVPTNENVIWRIRTNQELQTVCDILVLEPIFRLEWMGDVNRNLEIAFDNRQYYKRNK